MRYDGILSVLLLLLASPGRAQQADPAGDTRNVAEQVWSVGASKLADGRIYCEAVARGLTKEAGGQFAIRYRPNFAGETMVIVTYAPPSIEGVGTMSIMLDGRRLASGPAHFTNLGTEHAIVASDTLGHLELRRHRRFQRRSGENRKDRDRRSGLRNARSRLRLDSEATGGMLEDLCNLCVSCASNGSRCRWPGCSGCGMLPPFVNMPGRR